MVRILPSENGTLETIQNSEENNKKQITNQHENISRYSDTEILPILTHVPTSDDRRENLEKKNQVTASTLHSAVGLGTLTQQQEHYDAAYLKKISTRHISDAIEHGIENEKHGVATIVGKILPAIYPTVRFHQVGCYVLWDNGKPFLVASPDGEGWEGQVRRLLFEIKCPYKTTDWKTPVHYSIPEYYIPQIICQMGTAKESLGYYVHESIFVSCLRNHQQLSALDLTKPCGTFYAQKQMYCS
ncbi:unnamed protein product [Mytilus coruscus]|uniref:YqaJ viral recombinase domain-containing protein n=1 Tax=Mytilus coruscus TaxID=42192 RepID=A0A6J8CIY7_MYTCO|nr:unnamed protein product [Mytilus coruscus]